MTSDTDARPVQLLRDGAVATILFDRPRAHNADVHPRIVFVSDCTKSRSRPQSLTKPRATAHVADTCTAWNGLHRPLARRTPP